MLFQLKPPTLPPTIRYENRSFEELIKEVEDDSIRLVHGDPPWVYSESPGKANPEANEIYTGLPDAVIAEHLDSTYPKAKSNARLVCWYTWPKEEEWRAAGMAGKRWGPKKTGGSWHKLHQFGVGYHWRGKSEPLALFTKGATGRPYEPIENGFESKPEEHSVKPLPFLRMMVRAWTEPGETVLDLYAGLGAMAIACVLEGRNYIGAEIDKSRWELGCVRIAHATSLRRD